VTLLLVSLIVFMMLKVLPGDIALPECAPVVHPLRDIGPDYAVAC